MSYRFTLQADASRICDHFGVTQLLAYVQSDRDYVPTGSVSAICLKGGQRVLDEFRWGLLPYWAKTAVQTDGRSLLNNKSFGYMLKRQRCVVPCSAYYKVVPAERRNRAPYAVMLHEGEQPLAMAGVYDVRISPQGEELRSCTILSVPSSAPGFEEDVPMLLGPKQMEAWLSPAFMDAEEVRDLVETIAERQPKPQLRALPQAAKDEGESIYPFPAY
ncbi:SOS response-associated peptidase family protein [Paenibacillus ginsengarvi]|nr:SOS response-associated peptidase family protein [Paenibacillus ginsengarvi]